MKLLKQMTLDGVTRRKDKSLKISFITATEQTSQELMEVDKLLDSSGVMYYKQSTGLSTDEIKQIDKVTLDKPNGKSNSERLRNVLYIYCKQKIGKEPTKEQFAEFYNKYMEKYITYIKDQLD
jgi:O-phosphoseryl-tRNA(Cys) synthetase